jgi:hypothetical protein
VQKSVIGSGCAGIDIAPFSQDALNPAQRQVPGNAGAGSSSTDNKYLSVQ